jgi:hypothetical protein
LLDHAIAVAAIIRSAIRLCGLRPAAMTRQHPAVGTRRRDVERD